MRITLDITQDSSGHLTGTAGAADGMGDRTFYGAMELLGGSIEELVVLAATRTDDHG
jgi:hypothetical protein